MFCPGAGSSRCRGIFLPSGRVVSDGFHGEFLEGLHDLRRPVEAAAAKPHTGDQAFFGKLFEVPP